MEHHELESRFTQHHVESGSRAGEVRDILLDAGKDILDVLDDTPVLGSIIQQLEAALHISLHAPDAAEPVNAGDAPTGPPLPESGGDTPAPDAEAPATQG